MLSQSNSGATFNYSLVGFNSSLTTNWQTKEVIISDVNNSGNVNFNKFRAGTKYVKLLVLFNYNSTPNTTLDISNISIRETNEKETLNIKEPLRCINNICDYLDFENNRIVRNIGEKVLSNNDSWYTYTPGANNILSYFITINDLKLGFNTSLSTHFHNLVNAWNVGVIGDYSDHPYVKNKYFVFGKTLNEFKNFLTDENNKGTPVTIYYQLENPRYESITLPNINTFNGTNKITISDGTMNPSKIDISYFS